MIADRLRVEPAGVQRASESAYAVAAVLAGVDLVGPLGRAASAVPGSAAAAAVGELQARLVGAAGALRTAVDAMGAALSATAGSYSAVDSHVAGVLAQAGAGLPERPAGSW